MGQLPKITQKITYKFIFFEFDENVGMGVCDYGEFISHISFGIGHRFEVPEGVPVLGVVLVLIYMYIVNIVFSLQFIETGIRKIVY